MEHVAAGVPNNDCIALTAIAVNEANIRLRHSQLTTHWGLLRSSATANACNSAIIKPRETAGSACMNARGDASSGASKTAMANVLSPDSFVGPARLNRRDLLASYKRAKCRSSTALSSSVQFLSSYKRGSR